mmetsp:Transcript_27470/g.58731  ORF Transcript_27470/g.58731 Transcript_27470/m.58731 type:complete len:278 (+) Transcript_27470:923-1756(+)
MMILRLNSLSKMWQCGCFIRVLIWSYIIAVSYCNKSSDSCVSQRLWGDNATSETTVSKGWEKIIEGVSVDRQCIIQTSIENKGELFQYTHCYYYNHDAPRSIFTTTNPNENSRSHTTQDVFPSREVSSSIHPHGSMVNSSGKGFVCTSFLRCFSTANRACSIPANAFMAFRYFDRWCSKALSRSTICCAKMSDSKALSRSTIRCAKMSEAIFSCSLIFILRSASSFHNDNVSISWSISLFFDIKSDITCNFDVASILSKSFSLLRTSNFCSKRDAAS